MKQRLGFSAFAAVIFVPALSWGQTPDGTQTVKKINLPKQTIERQSIEQSLDPRVQQAWDIIDDIKAANPRDNLKIEMRSGLLQVFSNNTDSIELNRLSTIPFVGAESYLKIYKNFGGEARFSYARNAIFPADAGSPNKDDAYQMTTDLGFRYRFNLDDTQIEDAVAIKILYSQTVNNFKISNVSEIYMKAYTGTILGVERSIPVTPKIGILASLDVNFIQDTESDSTVDYLKTGIGFSMRGAAHYKVDWFGVISKIGGAYWQGGMVNRLAPGAQSDAAKTSHVQTFRAVSLSLMGQF